VVKNPDGDYLSEQSRCRQAYLMKTLADMFADRDLWSKAERIGGEIFCS
jgi:hypothetical protein